MKSRLASDEGNQRIFILILDAGEDAFAAISEFAAQQRARR